MTQPNCTLVLGMHRSGTSMLAGVYRSLGYDLGKSIALQSFDNPKGFNENYRIQEFNDKLLQSINSSWRDPRVMTVDWLAIDSLSELQQEARQLLTREFGNNSDVIIKDPRHCLTLPFWQPILEFIFATVNYVFIIRHPDEIIDSLQQRNHIAKPQALDLIAKYWVQAERATRGKERVVLSFNEVIQMPQASLQRTGVSLEKMTTMDLTTLIDPTLKNYNSSSSEIKEHVSYKLHELFIDGIERKESAVEFDSALAGLKQKVYSPDYNTKENFAKILVDTGGKYNEASSVIKEYRNNVLNWVCDLNQYEDVVSILIQPVHHKCKIEVIKLEVCHSPSSIEYELSNNAYESNGREFLFDQDFPRYIVSFKKAVNDVQIDLQLRILPLDEHKPITKAPQSNLSAILSLIFWYPLRVLRQVNYSNWKILRSALRRESPNQIIRNFIKLIRRPDHQKAIEEISNSQKATFFDEENKLNKLKEPRMAVGSNVKGVNQEFDLRLLYVTPTLPEYDKSSGGRRATNYLDILAETHHVTICVVNQIEERYARSFLDKEIQVLSYDSLLNEASPGFDSIIFTWYYTFLEAQSLATKFPLAFIVIDTVDVHWVREQRALLIGELNNEHQIAKNKDNEIRAYQQAGMLWAVTDEDRKAILLELPNAEVALVPNIHNLIPRKFSLPQERTLLFFGGYTHHPNVTAVSVLALEIFPLIRRAIPDVKLLIAGSNAPPEVLGLAQNKGISFLGFIEEEDLPELYAKSSICIAPLLSGAGMKGKITEAINYMCPVVTTSIGNEGIGLIHEENALISDDNGDLSELVIKALKGDYDLEAFAQRAKIHLQEILDPQKIKSVLNRSIFRPVDICIVTWNRLNLLQDCIASILKQTQYPNYHILVYSNGCTDGTRGYLQDISTRQPYIETIFAEGNEGFVKPNNRLMSRHKNRDIVLLNNDTLVTHNWLRELQKTAYRDENVGIVGSKLLYPNGSLQEFGAVIYEDGTGMNYGKHEEPNTVEYMKPALVPYVSGCAMYIKRSTINRIGKFDEAFHPCYFEDSDYCYRAWKEGLGTAVTPDSIIYHIEGGTAGVEIDQGFKKYQQVNKTIFHSKHKNHLRKLNQKIRKANSQFQKHREQVDHSK